MQTEVKVSQLLARINFIFIKTSDLLQALSSFLQSFLQPLELSGRVCHVFCDFIRAVVEDSVETEHPQTRLYQLRVETPCRNRTKQEI